MPWLRLSFSKHIGESLPQIVLLDSDWFFWAMEKEVFKDKEALEDQANEIAQKATRIKIPKIKKYGSEKLVMEYVIHPSEGTFVSFEIVLESQPPHNGSTQTFRLPYIDLSAPHRIAQNNKSGSKLLLSAFKFYYFGDSEFNLTRQQCEAFFHDNSNFDLPFEKV